MVQPGDVMIVRSASGMTVVELRKSGSVKEYSYGMLVGAVNDLMSYRRLAWAAGARNSAQHTNAPANAVLDMAKHRFFMIPPFLVLSRRANLATHRRWVQSSLHYPQ